VMFNIFSRINTGGLRLNGQEIRHAMNKGPVREYLRGLASTTEFLKATDNSVKPLRMADRECVLRFLAFYIDPWEKYPENDLDGFLGRAMQKLNAMGDADRQLLKGEFLKAMNAAKSIFGNDAFRKRYDLSGRKNPVSKALFEAWSVELARCSANEIHNLTSHRQKIRESFVKLMKDDRAFDVSISYSTGVPQRVRKRFASIRDLIKRYI
jgi:hypothetical protein